MDDSTSALDMETEHMIQQTLKTLDHTTKIIIAHRISAVRNADEILVLADGAIAERGTHETLLAKRGLYYETYLSQYGEASMAGTGADADGGADAKAEAAMTDADADGAMNAAEALAGQRSNGERQTGDEKIEN